VNQKDRKTLSFEVKKALDSIRACRPPPGRPGAKTTQAVPFTSSAPIRAAPEAAEKT